jgi:hypothetical protein
LILVVVVSDAVGALVTLGIMSRHEGVAWLVLADADEAAAARDLEGTAGAVDGVRDVHGRSLADSLGVAGNRRGPDECYRRAMTPSSTTPALKLS